MIDEIRNLITGLQSKLGEARTRRDAFLKAKGIEEEIAKTRLKLAELSPEIAKTQEDIKNIAGKKSDIVAGLCARISEKMSEVLPYGTAVFKIEDNNLFIGWDIPERGVVPYEGLSGGQKVAFKPALGYILAGDGSKLVVIEAAEMDKDSLEALLLHLVKARPSDTQFIVNTWFQPSEIPNEWEVTIL
jgi:hypothetical protein